MPTSRSRKDILFSAAAAPELPAVPPAPAGALMTRAVVDSRRILKRGATGRFEGARVITDADVAEIHKLARLGYTDGQIAKKLRISRPAVTQIKNGKRRRSRSSLDELSGSTDAL